MPHPHLARASNSILVVIDFQEPFARAMVDRQLVANNITTLLHMARIHKLPVLVTEQNNTKLGPTVPELTSTMEQLEVYDPIDKSNFSCCGSEEFLERLYGTGRDTLIMTGLETHVCIQQTALEALDLGFKVHVIRDAVASRHDLDKDTALDKLRHAGAIISTTELASYELLERAGTPEFTAAMKHLKWNKGQSVQA